jgi:hypothetical protein
MKNMFKNEWAEGGIYYPNEVLDASKVLGSYIHRNTVYDNFPKFQDLLRNYPNFGKIPSAYPCDVPQYLNQCAIRVSTAFYLSGHSFEKVSSNHSVDFCPKHGFRHVRSAVTLATSMMIKKYGYGKHVKYTPASFKKKFAVDLSEESFNDFFGSKTGLIYQFWMKNGGVHIDLYDRGITGSGNYLDSVGASTESVACFMFWEIH